MKMKHIVAPLALSFSLAASTCSVWAQPGENNGPPIDGPNPPNAQDGRRGNRPNFREMTPEQRAQMQQQMQQQRELGMRQMLIMAKITDQAVQNAIIDHVNAVETARQTLQDKARAVTEGLRNNAITDSQLAALLADFRAAVAAEKTRRETALKELDEDIKYTENPRLDALLTLGGVIGDEASILNSGIGGGRGGMGMGVFGGQGGRRGEGGQGGRRGEGGGRNRDND